jgi:beta-barrel assembly-enhancing protease
VTGMHAYTAKEVSSGAWKSQSPNQTVGVGVNQAVGETVDLNTTAEWKTFHGSGFSIDVPGNWQGYGSEISAMFGPAGGVARSAAGGAGGVIYGMLTDRYQPQGRLSISAALDALVAEITHDNTGLVPDSRTHATAGGGAGRSVECNNPSGNNGKGERDWIVAFQQRDGALRYFVFVAPTPDFEKLRPTFARMIETVRLQ